MPQKKRLKQLEKRQRLRERGKKQEKPRIEKTIGSVDIPDLSGEDLMNHLRGMKAITPAEVAIRLNVKVSVAKRLLETLRRDEVVDLVSRSHNLKVYALSQG